MHNPIMTYLFNFLSVIAIILLIGYIVFEVVKAAKVCKKIRQFSDQLTSEMREELTVQYQKLCDGEIEIEEFYEREQWSGQLFSKIFEDYKNDLTKGFYARKGRTKVK